MYRGRTADGSSWELGRSNKLPILEPELADYRSSIGFRVEALNHTLTIAREDRIRFHVCWGNFEGPHENDFPLIDVVDLVLRLNAQAYSIEGANPRHAPEWQIWEEVKFPEGKILIPGVIDTVTTFVEHPESSGPKNGRSRESSGERT